jgi:hypothetical protein
MERSWDGPSCNDRSLKTRTFAELLFVGLALLNSKQHVLQRRVAIAV